MADQEFLASFAVDIDEAGVSRLQKILADNKALADNVSAAFRAAAKALKEFAGTLPTLFTDCRADPGERGKRNPRCGCSAELKRLTLRVPVLRVRMRKSQTQI